MSSKPKKNRTKQYLMLLTVAGLIAIVGGSSSGTFASFTAETTNAGNYFATGSLLLHNVGVDSQGNATTLCKSEAGSNNANTGCDALFSVPASNGTDAAWAKLTLSNAGSINASSITIDDGGTACSLTEGTQGASGNLATALTSAQANVTVLHLSSLSVSLVAGDGIMVTEASTGTAQTFIVSKKVASNVAAVNVSVVSTTASAGFSGSAQTISSAPVFANPSALTCSGLDFMIVESTDSAYTGFTGNNTGASTTGSNLTCVYPYSATPPCTFASNSVTLDTLPGTGSPASLTSDGTTDIPLAAGENAYFYIGVKPTLSPVANNDWQNHKFNFDLHWTLNQA